MKIPLWTLLLCGIATVVFFNPSFESVIIYDRISIIGGEWWRLITGNLVHFSAMHFTYNVLALLVLGTIIELRRVRYLWLVYTTSGAVIGLVIYIALPEMRFYGGLSGIVTAAVVYLCLDGFRDPGALRWLSLFILTLVIFKIGIEFMFDKSFFLVTDSQPFIPTPLSHLAGACTALFVYLLIKGIRSLCECGSSACTVR